METKKQAPKKQIVIVGFGASTVEAVVRMPDEKKRWLNILGETLNAAFPNTFPGQVYVKSDMFHLDYHPGI